MKEVPAAHTKARDQIKNFLICSETSDLYVCKNWLWYLYFSMCLSMTCVGVRILRKYNSSTFLFNIFNEHSNGV